MGSIGSVTIIITPLMRMMRFQQQMHAAYAAPARPQPGALPLSSLFPSLRGCGMSTPKRVIDWHLLEVDYRAGIKSLRQLSAEYGVSHVMISKKGRGKG